MCAWPEARTALPNMQWRAGKTYKAEGVTFMNKQTATATPSHSNQEIREMALNVLVVDDSVVVRRMIVKTLGLTDIPIGEVH